MPLSDRGRTDQARARANRRGLAAKRLRTEAALRARFAELYRRIAALAASRAEAGDIDLDALRARATRRYLGGVGPLTAVVEVLDTTEAEEMARQRLDSELRGARLSLSCQAGLLPEPEMRSLVEGAL